jgi:hypothetical protein
MVSLIIFMNIGIYIEIVIVYDEIVIVYDSSN